MKLLKKIFDSFVTDIIFAIGIILIFLFEEERLYPGHSINDDILLGFVYAIGASFFAEVVKILLLGRWMKLKDLLIGSILGFFISFGIYIIFLH